MIFFIIIIFLREGSLDRVISHRHKHPHLHSFLMVDVKEFRIKDLNTSFQSLHKSVLLSGHLCALVFPNWFWPEGQGQKAFMMTLWS